MKPIGVTSADYVCPRAYTYTCTLYMLVHTKLHGSLKGSKMNDSMSCVHQFTVCMYIHVQYMYMYIHMYMSMYTHDHVLYRNDSG